MKKLAADVSLGDVVEILMHPDTALYRVNDTVYNPERRPPTKTFNLLPVHVRSHNPPMALTVGMSYEFEVI